MTNSKHVPKRRFKEFESDGEWGQESLGKIVDFSIKTNSLSREKLSLESYEVQNIHYGDVLIKFDNVLDLQRDSLPSIIDSKVLDFKESLLQDGDLIFADAAEDSTVGKAIEIRNIGGKNIVSGLHTIAARPTQLFAPFYLGYYINSNFYHDQILPLMQGTKVSSISKSNLQVTKITFPTIDEQKELGKFFQTIDSLITLHQHKLDKLKNLKKAYLAELFPADGERVPKRRFPGFEGEWEEKKLGEVIEKFDNLRIPVASKDRIAGNIPYYGANGIQDYVEGFTHDGEFILLAEDGANDLNDYPVQYVNGKVWVNNHAHVIQGKNNLIDNKFLLFAIKQIQMEPYLVGGGRAKLNAEIMMNLPLTAPGISEQRIIGEFLMKVEKQISLQQQKLDKLKDLKKAYLNELFV